MRLITFKLPNELTGILFTRCCEPVANLKSVFPFLSGCKIQHDIQLDIMQDEIPEGKLFLPLDESFEELEPFSLPIISNLEAIGESISNQLELEKKTELLMNEIYNKAKRNYPIDPLPLE